MVRPLAIAKIEAIAAQKKKVPSQKKKSKLSLVIAGRYLIRGGVVS